MIDVPHFMTKVDENTPPEVVRLMLIAAQRATLEGLEREALLADEKAFLAQEKTVLAQENALLKQKLFGHSSEKKT